MAIARRKGLLENLAIGAALGLLALLMAGLSLVAESREISVEKALLAPNGEASVAGASSLAGSRFFDRVYRISDASGQSYGAIIALRSPASFLLAAGWFSRNGALKDLQVIGSPSTLFSGDTASAIASFPDSEDAMKSVSEAIAAAEGSAEAGS